jgi:hypothetical protein
MSRYRLLMIFVGILLTGLLIYTVIYLITPRSTIVLRVAPTEVYLSIDDNPVRLVKNLQTINLAPGSHSLTFSRDEFDSKTIEVITENGESRDIISALNPLTDAARDLLLNDESDAVIQLQTGESIIEDGQKLREKYPILKDLPITARLYVVNVCKSVKYPDDETKIALCADVYHDGLKPYIEKDISNLGYNPKDYEIIYIKKY